MKKIYTLLVGSLLALITVTPLFSQVNAIGVGVSGGDMSTTLRNFTTDNISIPSANSRVLVVTVLVQNAVTINAVEFKETGKPAVSASLANSGSNTLQLAIYYLPLAGIDALNGTITVTTNLPSDFGIFARAFENVDPDNPIDITSNHFMVHSMTGGVSVPSTNENMVIDIRSASTTLGIGIEQTDLANPLFSNQVRSTYKLAQGGTTTMDNNQPSQQLVTALNFVTPPTFQLSGDGNIANGSTQSFGDVLLEENGLSKTFTISNTGGSVLRLTASTPIVQITGTNASDFTVINAPDATIASNSSTTFKINFNPLSLGLRTATVTIPTNIGSASFILQGNGIQATTSATVIPTLSQWGLAIFGLLLLNLGVFILRQKKLEF